MNLAAPSLRLYPGLLRAACTCFLAMLLLGYAASLYHMIQHVGRKDGVPGLSRDDIVGTYSGIRKSAPILAALDDAKHRPWLGAMGEADRELIRRWLGGELSAAPDPIAAAYLDPPPGAPEDAEVPADVLDRHCGECHGATGGGGAGARVALKRWPDVAPHAYSKTLDPVSLPILAQSIHAHALTMPVFAALVALLLLGTRWSVGLRRGLAFLMMLGLFLDLFGMLAARAHVVFVYGGVLFGGALFGAAFGLAALLVLLDLWLPLRAGRKPAP